ncbi:BBE domain-containing protein [Arthrobacter koreensis]
MGQSLSALKSAVDPQNLFRRNHNIAPAAPGLPSVQRQ